MTKQAKNPSEVLIDISTAIIRVEDGAVQCRIVYGEDGLPDRLPFGAFLPHKHRTMEIGLREFVWQQVGVKLGHVEQLYTFADQSRHQLGQDG
ncbi:MAG: NAD regulator, partial [Parvibaculales bacterium]